MSFLSYFVPKTLLSEYETCLIYVCVFWIWMVFFFVWFCMRWKCCVWNRKQLLGDVVIYRGSYTIGMFWSGNPCRLRPNVASVGHTAVCIIISARWTAIRIKWALATKQLLEFLFADLIPPANTLQKTKTSHHIEMGTEFSK